MLWVIERVSLKLVRVKGNFDYKLHGKHSLSMEPNTLQLQPIDRKSVFLSQSSNCQTKKECVTIWRVGVVHKM